MRVFLNVSMSHIQLSKLEIFKKADFLAFYGKRDRAINV